MSNQSTVYVKLIKILKKNKDLEVILSLFFLIGKSLWPNDRAPKK